MSPGTLVRRNLTRHKTRLVLTVVAIAIAFTLYGVMAAFRQNFSLGGTADNSNRLITVNRVGFLDALPIRYVDQIRKVPGVAETSYRNMVVSYYQDPKQLFATLAVDPASYLRVYSDYVVDDADRAAFVADQSSVIIGQALAKRFGLSKGQIVPIGYRPSTTDPRYRVDRFKVAGIFSGRDEGVGTGLALMHFDTVNEAKLGSRDTVDAIVLRTSCTDCTDQVGRAIDGLFGNSAYETRTQTEEAFSRALVSQIGNISLITAVVTGAGFFTILLIAGSAMSASIRGRASEIGVLRTIGFPARQILGMILAESVAIAAIGGLLGMSLAALATNAMRTAEPATFGRMAITTSSASLALMLIFVFGVAVAILPALRALRADVHEVLARRPA